jgi:hypothetical protein
MQTDNNARFHELELQLELVTKNLEREMRARGFDPTQVENAALPTPLARLYLERQSLVEELEQMRRDSEQ